MNVHLRHDLTKSSELLEDPGHSVGLTVFQLEQSIRDLEKMRTDPLAGRHVYASRVQLERAAIRLMRLASQVANQC
jgi:hypothetical protein